MNTFLTTLAPRFLAGFGTLALLGAGGLAVSRPARSAGGPVPVTVANTVPTVDTESPAQQPHQEKITLVFNGSSTAYNFDSVPAGKRLVIESLTADGAIANTQSAYTVTLDDSSHAEVGLSLVRGTEPYPIKTQPVRITFEAGETPLLHMYSSTNNNAVTVSFSGYYVDVP